MATVLLVIHLMIAASLVGVVLLQRSEGGALGIGGGGGGFLTGRGPAKLLTRVTAGLAAAFFVTSLALTVLHQHSTSSGPLLGRGGGATPAVQTDQMVPAVPTPPASGDQTPAPAGPGGRGGILDKLQAPTPGIPQSK